MCDFVKAISRAFTAPGTGGLEAKLEQQQAAADAANKDYSDALTKAMDAAKQAALPAADNESARSASDDRMRKLMASQGGAWSFLNAPTAAPNVATKTLLGQ